MRLLFVSGSFNQGGAEYQILALANLMKEFNHEVQVIAITDYDFYKPYLRKKDIKFSCFNNDDSTFKRVWKLSRFIKDYKPEAIISFLKNTSLATIIAKILSAHSCKLLVSERTAFIKPARDFFHFSFWHYANVITTNSVSKIEYFRRNFPYISKKLFFVSNIYDAEVFSPPLKEEIIFSNDCINFVYVGRISPEKNLVNLIKAFSVLNSTNSNIKLSLFGDSRNQQYKRELDLLINELKLEERVSFMGAVNNEYLKSVYRQADMLCLLSEYEGFSNVLAEAMIHGCIALTSNIPENEFIVKDKINGFLVDRNSTDSIVKGFLEYLRLNTEDKLKMRSENKKRAGVLFDRVVAYNKFLGLLQ